MMFDFSASALQRNDMILLIHNNGRVSRVIPARTDILDVFVGDRSFTIQACLHLKQSRLMCVWRGYFSFSPSCGSRDMGIRVLLLQALSAAQ